MSIRSVGPTREWYRIDAGSRSTAETYILRNEIFLNSLGIRLRACTTRRDFQKWAVFLRSPHAKSEYPDGIFAVHRNGFAAIMTDDAPESDSEFAGLWKQAGSRLPDIRILMGPSACVRCACLSRGKLPEAAVEYDMLSKTSSTRGSEDYRHDVGALSRPAADPIAQSAANRTEPGEFVCSVSSETDLERILPLQIAYEKEEVLLPGHRLNLQTTELGLRSSLRYQLAVHGEYRGQIVSKAMTNARGIHTDQIGGVYTVPEFRGMGFAYRVMEEILSRIFAAGNQASLFVKTDNHCAQKLYRKLGFRTEGRYSIVYYS